MLVNKVMADNRLDALVLPDQDHTGAAAGKPRRTDHAQIGEGTTTVKIDGVEYERTVENRSICAAPLTPRLSPNAGLPTIAVPAGFTREVYDRAVVRGRMVAKSRASLSDRNRLRCRSRSIFSVALTASRF